MTLELSTSFLHGCLYLAVFGVLLNCVADELLTGLPVHAKELKLDILAKLPVTRVLWGALLGVPAIALWFLILPPLYMFLQGSLWALPTVLAFGVFFLFCLFFHAS